ncbi:hypothetical protein HKD37_18G050300 [Glycine soja]
MTDRPDEDEKIFCPCINCLNERRQKVNDIQEHLLCDGIKKNYTMWIWHGELTDMQSKPINASQGSFVAHRRQDVLTTAIGRPEHPDHVHAVGAGVTIKQYFGPAPRNFRTSSSMAPEDLEQLTPSFSRRCNHRDSHYLLSLRLVLQLLVSAQMRVVLIPQGTIQTRVTDKCGLYIKENPPRLVALGRLYEGSTTVHNIHLLHDQVKVGVEEVRDTDAPISVPIDEVKLVGQTLNTFLVWLTHLVKPMLDKQGAVGPVKPADRSNHDIDDPLYLMTLTIPQFFMKSFQVVWDAIVFGVYNDNFLLYIKHEYLPEIAYSGNADVYGFLEPPSIQRSGQSQFESESYIKNWMQNSRRDVYLGAYLNGPNNYLKGIINMLVLFFNTFALALVGNINILIVQYISMFVFSSALKGLDDTPQSKSKATTRWIVVKCNGQKGSTKCGYYVMH